MLLPRAKDEEAASSDDTICRPRGISCGRRREVEVITAATHAYRPGEEVIVRLAGVDVHNSERGVGVEATCLPTWTIGVVIDCAALDGGPAYVMRLDHDGCACVCVAPETSIEGVA
jgi:hypothetical protein